MVVGRVLFSNCLKVLYHKHPSIQYRRNHLVLGAECVDSRKNLNKVTKSVILPTAHRKEKKRERTLPSKSSKEAPPPVDTCDRSFSLPALATTVAVSPPPTITVDPFLVASMAASKREDEPLANAGNSNTPAGPFQRIVLDSSTVARKASFDLGPASSPIHPSGMPSESEAVPV